jgi:hypothetical protein
LVNDANLSYLRPRQVVVYKELGLPPALAVGGVLGIVPVLSSHHRPIDPIQARQVVEKLTQGHDGVPIGKHARSAVGCRLRHRHEMHHGPLPVRVQELVLVDFVEHGAPRGEVKRHVVM